VSVPAQRRRPSQTRSRDKVGRIVSAARRILVREGPEAFNTNRIAAEAGVGVGSVYEYFADKRAVAARVLDELAEREAQEVLACFERVTGRPLDEAIRAVVETVYALYVEHHPLYRALWVLAPRGRQVGNRPGEVLIRRTIKRWLEPHARTLEFDDVDLAVLTTFHLVESLAMQMASHRGAWSDEACVEQIVRAVRGYLGLS
jgi:AcrR family transcriptional regulator